MSQTGNTPGKCPGSYVPCDHWDGKKCTEEKEYFDPIDGELCCSRRQGAIEVTYPTGLQDENAHLMSLLKEILYEVEISRQEARCVFPLDLIERLEKTAVKGKLPGKVKK